MFSTAKTLIVVYKDEMLVNQIKKLVQSRDDTDENSVVGTKDSSINIVSWNEKVWLGNKEAGNIKDKVLFLDSIKGTDKLIPVIDVKFDDCGVRFGWAGNQAILYVDPRALSKREDYLVFLEKLSALPVPDIIKNGNKPKAGVKESDQQKNETQTVPSEDTAKEPAKKKGVLEKAKEAVESGAGFIGDKFKAFGDGAAVLAEDVFRDKTMVRKQMLFYGTVNLYNECLESFMNM